MTEELKLPTSPSRGNKPGLWPSIAATVIRKAIENCLQHRHMGLIIGPSGVGKTTAARAVVAALAEADEDREARYVMMTRAAEGVQPGLLRIAQAIGAQVSPHMGANDLHDAITLGLPAMPDLLVLDEAQFMSDALLHAVRGLWDELDARRRPVAIVMLGTPDLRLRFGGRDPRRRREFEALLGRLGVNLDLDPIAPEDVQDICAHLGISGPQSIGVIERIVCAPGGLHNLRRLVLQLRGVLAEGSPPSLDQVKQAAFLVGGVGDGGEKRA